MEGHQETPHPGRGAAAHVAVGRGLAMLPPGTGSPEAVSRTLLELTACIMDASFEALGEGVMLGTMPKYLEAFGARNAKHVRKHHVTCDANEGAVSALAPLNFISKVTETPFDLLDPSRNQATKRLHACEFAAAFGPQGPFGRAMICRLHQAVYQGSVNGLLPPGQPGYEVQVKSRILFGDPHCDFQVTSLADRGNDADPGGTARSTPDAAQRATDSLHFYMAILVAFVDYLTTVMPQPAVESMLARCAGTVGVKVAGFLGAEAQDARTLGETTVAAVLLAGGRTLAPVGPAPAANRLPMAVATGPQGLVVQACPFAQPIMSNTRRSDLEAERQVRLNVCGVCHGMLRGAVAQLDGQLDVVRDSCLTVGDDACRFRVVAP